MKEKLLGKTLEELEAAAVSCGLKPFVGRQLADWLYSKKTGSWDRMLNISKASKAALEEVFEIGTTPPLTSVLSTDGTHKYLFKTEGKSPIGIETVMIPEEKRKTLCVSSQAGCRMGCKFCMTGRQGFHGNLQAADILNQFISIDEKEELTNAVFMGMGEPLDNYAAVSRTIEILTAPWGFGWSPKRITLSTIGITPKLKTFLDEQQCHLAISLHNPFPEERLEFMPSQKNYPISEILNLIRQKDFSGQRRVSFEYIMFAGYNDGKRHADALSRLLKGLECRVNLIHFNPIPDFPYDCSPDVVIEAFQERLKRNGIVCTTRISRGRDIMAACGMLAGQR